MKKVVAVPLSIVFSIGILMLIIVASYKAGEQSLARRCLSVDKILSSATGDQLFDLVNNLAYRQSPENTLLLSQIISDQTINEVYNSLVKQNHQQEAVDFLQSKIEAEEYHSKQISIIYDSAAKQAVITLLSEDYFDTLSQEQRKNIVRRLAFDAVSSPGTYLGIVGNHYDQLSPYLEPAELILLSRCACFYNDYQQCLQWADLGLQIVESSTDESNLRWEKNLEEHREAALALIELFSSSDTTDID